MNKLEIVKGVGELLTSIGVSAIVGNAIKMTADPDAGKIKKVAVAFGGFVLSSMVADQATAYLNDRVDSTADSLSKILKRRKKTEDISEEITEKTTEGVYHEVKEELDFDFNEITMPPSDYEAWQREHSGIPQVVNIQIDEMSEEDLKALEVNITAKLKASKTKKNKESDK